MKKKQIYNIGRYKNDGLTRNDFVKPFDFALLERHNTWTNKLYKIITDTEFKTNKYGKIKFSNALSFPNDKCKTQKMF